METGIKRTQTLLLKRAQLASCRGNLGEAQIKSKSEAASTALVKSLRRKKKTISGLGARSAQHFEISIS